MNSLQHDLAKQEGAMEFCFFLRGKVNPDALLEAWEAFSLIKGGELRALTNPQTYEDARFPL